MTLGDFAPQASSAAYALIVEPDQGLTAIYDLIASAKKSIDMTMYELTDITITSMLGKAAAAGIEVRVILDQNDEKKTNTPAYNHLEENKVAVHWANPTFTATHQKTITVDSATSAIMTLNLDAEDYPTSRDFAIITGNAVDVAAIETTFEADFKNEKITPPTGQNLVWSPTNARSALAALIGGAKKSLLIEQEEFSDAGMVSACEAALQRGVALTLVEENMDQRYSADLTALKTAGARIATYDSQSGYYIHAKIVLADYGTPQAKMFLGSENFTEYSLDKNRELGLIFSDAATMAAVEAALTADFSNGAPF